MIKEDTVYALTCDCCGEMFYDRYGCNEFRHDDDMLDAAAVVCGEGPTEGERAARERRERVEWRCWHDEWADTREAQRRYLEQRNAR